MRFSMAIISRSFMALNSFFKLTSRSMFLMVLDVKKRRQWSQREQSEWAMIESHVRHQLGPLFFE